MRATVIGMSSEAALGTVGYAECATNLALRWNAVPFIDKHHAVLHCLPDPPTLMLDVGAGSGADAAWLAERGHTVVAVEPVAALRATAQATYRSSLIRWVDDYLPQLASLNDGARYAVILLSAVWMHLDTEERERAMPRVVELLALDGFLILSLRHGPVPAGRRMFDVSPEETLRLARACSLVPRVDRRGVVSTQAANRAAGVTWTQFAFTRCTARS